jgi:threonyl-tRNA synthetase
VATSLLGLNAGVRVVTNADYPALEKIAEGAVKDKQPFERLVVSKENLLEMFSVRRRRWPFVRRLIDRDVPVQQV